MASKRSRVSTTVRVNGETFRVDLSGLKFGDVVKHVGEQCEGCGNALDCKDEHGGAEAIYLGSGVNQIRCSACGATYPIEKDS